MIRYPIAVTKYEVNFGLNVEIIVIALAMTFAVLAYSEYRKRVAAKNMIKFDLADLNMKSIEPSKASLEVKIRLYNPNSVPATLNMIDYSVYGNDEYLARDSYSNKMDIAPGTLSTVSKTFEIANRGVATPMWDAVMNRSVVWKIVGTISLDSVIGSLNIPFKFER